MTRRISPGRVGPERRRRARKAPSNGRTGLVARWCQRVFGTRRQAIEGFRDTLILLGEVRNTKLVAEPDANRPVDHG